VPGSSLGFDPFVHQGLPAPQPYYRVTQPVYPARPVARPITHQQPRPPVARPEPIAVPQEREQAAMSAESLKLPPPGQLGIHLSDPPVVLPAPEALGIKLN